MNLLVYGRIFDTFQQFQQQQVKAILFDDHRLNDFILRRDLFVKLMKGKYKELSDKKEYVIASENWASLTTGVYSSKRVVYNKNLINLLGAS